VGPISKRLGMTRTQQDLVHLALHSDRAGAALVNVDALLRVGVVYHQVLAVLVVLLDAVDTVERILTGVSKKPEETVTVFNGRLSVGPAQAGPPAA